MDVGDTRKRDYDRERDRNRERTSRMDQPRRSRSRSASPKRSKHEKRPEELKSSRHRSRSPTNRRRSRSRERNSSRREHSRSRSRERRKRSASRSHSRERKHRKKHHARRDRSRSGSDSDSSLDEERRRRKKDKKREKKEKKKLIKQKFAGAEWGKYGILTETDMYTKDAEFRTWLIEEKVVNLETLPKDQTKKMFKEFMEDFNTATLPHEKYYDMEKYEKRMNLLRSGEMGLAEPLITYDARADMAAHTMSMKKAPAQSSTHLSREQLMDLRKVQMERDQLAKMKILGVTVDSTFGVRMDGNEFDTADQ